ncbi:MAG: hypothetical protein ABGZ53_16075 [Fuerstiella sp.]
MDAALTVESLKPLLGQSDIVAADQRSNSVIVKAGKDIHEQIQDLLATLDTPEPDLKVVIMPLKTRPNRAILEVIAMVGRNTNTTDFTFDEDRNVLVFRGRDSDIAMIQEIVRELSLVSVPEKEAFQILVPTSLRVVWLETNDEKTSTLMTPELAEAVAPLKDVGIANLKVVSQMVLHVGAEDSKPEAQTFIMLNGHEQVFRIQGRVRDHQVAQQFELQLTADSTELAATVTLQKKQWVVLGVVGTPAKQSVFAIQRMDR